jgi:hypothetical protein
LVCVIGDGRCAARMKTESFIHKCDPVLFEWFMECVRILEDAFLPAPLMVGPA